MPPTVPLNLPLPPRRNATHNRPRNSRPTKHKKETIFLYFPWKDCINLQAAPAEVKAAPNTFVGYHDIGLPGSLPILNKEAVLLAVKAALALGCTVNYESSFDRKHYFYKDLPSGYQITQQYHPLAVKGSVAITKADDTTNQLQEDFLLPITRIQIEQDTAKTTKLPHIITSPSPFAKFLLDHNRSSIPLIEIITPPVLTTAHHAATAFAKVVEILRAIGSTTADLHHGAMRCDVNVSLGYNSPRTEIKNLFSVRAVRDSCTYEIEQQIQLYEQDEDIVQSTKTWNGEKTVLLRTKEGEKDYRYLPDADLPPILLNDEFIRMARDDLPPLPDYLVTILMREPHNLNIHMAKRLAKSPSELSFYNSVMEMGKSIEGSMLCNWLIYQLIPLLHRYEITLEESPFTVEHMTELLSLLRKQIINADGGKLLIETYLSPNDPPSISVYNHPLLPKLSNRSEENEQLRQNVIDIISSTQLQKTVRGVHSVEKKYMGVLMSRRKGKVDVNLAMTIIKEEMEKRLVFEPTTRGSKLLKVQHRLEVKTEA